jgi:regulator of sigma E protease
MQTVLNFVIFVVALCFVILVHELGHLALARLAKVEVEEFSIGWGKRLLSWRKGGTLYLLKAFPIGGYCKMKGETEFRAALAKGADDFDPEPGSFFAAKPLWRCAISFAGPMANALLACLLFALSGMIGKQYPSVDSRILLLSGVQELAEPMPADISGLKDGDRVIRAGGRPVSDYDELRGAILSSANSALPLVVERDGEEIELVVTPRLDPSSGSGFIGIVNYRECVAEAVEAGSPADRAGILPGDKIIEVDGKPVRHTYDLGIAFAGRPQRLNVVVERSGQALPLTILLEWAEGEESTLGKLGIGFPTVMHVDHPLPLFDALAHGSTRAIESLGATLKGIALLFQGIDIVNSIGGPARMFSYYDSSLSVKDPALATSNAIELTAAISVTLFVVNLLPIPAVDGGQILLFLFELIRRKRPKPKSIQKYQMAGWFVIIGLITLSFASDLIFFTR